MLWYVSFLHFSIRLYDDSTSEKTVLNWPWHFAMPYRQKSSQTICLSRRLDTMRGCTPLHASTQRLPEGAASLEDQIL